MSSFQKHLRQFDEEGWVLIEDFLSQDELSAARETLAKFYPTVQAYEADKEKHAWLQGDPFAGEIYFPFSDAFLNNLVTHLWIVEFAEQALGFRDIRLLRAHLQAKFVGAANYDQPLHFDYPNHTLVVPGPAPEDRQVGFFLYFSDVTEDLGPTCLVPKKYTRELPPGYTHFFRDEASARGRHFFKEARELYDVETPATGPAGSLLIYDLNTLHRGSAMTVKSGVRLTLGFAYGSFRAWQGYQSWPRLAEDKEMMAFMTRATPRQRDLLGFPPVGDPYWTEETAAGVGARYPGMDLKPYRDAINMT